MVKKMEMVLACVPKDTRHFLLLASRVRSHGGTCSGEIVSGGEALQPQKRHGLRSRKGLDLQRLNDAAESSPVPAVISCQDLRRCIVGAQMVSACYVKLR